MFYSNGGGFLQFKKPIVRLFYPFFVLASEQNTGESTHIMIRFPVHRVSPYFANASGIGKLTPVQPPFVQPTDTSSQRAKRFAVIGDSGSGTLQQHLIGHRMWQQYQRNPFASVVVLGDNVYEDGEPKLFQARIQKPYAPLFENGVNFYPVLGNHDVRKGYGEKQLSYWNVPRWYNVKLGDKGNEVELFAIDTTLMVPTYDRAYNHDLPNAARLAAKQQQWLEEQLAASTAKYKIVYGHFPMYTSGQHAHTQKTAAPMRELLEPMLKKYGVDVYLAGHEHLYERSAPIDGVRHIVSGTAGKMGSVYQPKARYPREALETKYQFMLFELTDNGLTFETIDRNNQIIDSGTINKGAATTVRFA